MAETETLLVVGCVAVFAAYGVLIYRYRTALLGLNGLNLFQVFSSTSSGFLVCVVFGRSLEWFSEAHAQVVGYGILGSAAMVGGMYLAWRPLREIDVQRPDVLTGQLGWLTFWAGLFFEALYPAVAQLPTVSTP